MQQRGLVEAIRQQSDDLRDELKELEQWEEQMEKMEESRKSSKRSPAAVTAVEPPIRGTVSSIKQAMSETARKEGKQLPPEQDPINIAKEKGNEYFRLGKISDAIHAYASGIDVDPHSASTHVLYCNRAMCYLKTMQWAEAEEDATTCVQMNRNYAKGYFRRAMARKNLGKLKEARLDLESVLALAPGDASALSEQEIVTKMIQVERARATAAPPTKKRIAIQEVDDDDEEEEEQENAKGSGATHTKSDDANTEEVLSPGEQKLRDARISAQMEELERERTMDAERARLEEMKQEQARNVRRKQNARVEVIEEEEEDVKPVVVKTAPSATPTTEQRAPLSEAPKQASTATEKHGTTTHKDPMQEPPKKKDVMPAPTPVPRPRTLPQKESLTAPKTFAEFERVFPVVEKDDELRNHYVKLMNPAGLPALFGSNMSPEMLVGMLRSIKQFSGSLALQFLKGLSKVNRIEDLTLFFNESEKKLVDESLNLTKASGASDKEYNAIKSKLSPF